MLLINCVAVYSRLVKVLYSVFTAPPVQFSKPLHDVEVREKESARFECEVSRENLKVNPNLFPHKLNNNRVLSPVGAVP